jgi:hypothetical protein
MSEAEAFRRVSNACPQSLSASPVTVGWKARGNVQGSGLSERGNRARAPVKKSGRLPTFREAR